MECQFHRGRRLRRTETLRAMFRETRLTASDLVQPYFVLEHENPEVEKPIGSMPGQYQLGLSALVETVRKAVDTGLQSVLLFGIPKEKDERGSQAYAEEGIVQQAVRELKETFPELVVVTDVCLCEYTSHGHCGLIRNGEVQNDPTLELIARTALSHARSGADIVAPSDMMDGRVAAIRDILDKDGYSHVPIISYAVKYASSFYGPFREAAESTPSFGDRRSYQMDVANAREGLREATADLDEGADALMVKPALPYLDILRDLRERFDCPLAAYQVSGEFSMIKAAAKEGWLDPIATALESLTAIKRAGADLIFSYFTTELLEKELIPLR
ncbi:porphobilinogen synthase [Oceanidesulfovibrio marinus]|uniref:Delta-aminolevulinic acid dehydratase n=1 Tax=Oceanidesulfovibrio marinus TaxID=370038 RepID=A0A6P1ZKU2_9BACT|nr:porphobilinogen synthase [Oceanidesulfovibrio marinus]QJT09178.1 porphobilinogen synthase [Oceanidesulfovibrio marinus]TVM36392.1 porphobilinogen synthase [Oceanidesulfovibrio marinus]